MRILAIDPSTTNIGWMVADGGAVEDWSTIALPGRKPVEQRVASAYAALAQLIDIQTPNVIAYEAQAYGTQAMALMCHSYVVGLLMALAGPRDIRLIKVAPTAAKKELAGTGNAKKPQMLAAARAALLDDDINEHEADAFGVLRCAWKELS